MHAEGRIGDPAGGDSLRLFNEVKDNVIREISYLVLGCSASIAISSIVTVLAKDRTIESALKITEEDIIKAFQKQRSIVRI